MTRNGTSARHIRHGCRGTTLVEMTVVIGLVTFLLASVAVSLHSMYRLDSRVRDNFTWLASGSNLSAALRSDAHAARSATVGDARIEADSPAKDDLTLVLDNGEQIIYSADGSQILRVVKRDGNVVHRDSFSIAEDTLVTWKVDSVDGRPFIVMSARPADGDGSELRCEMELHIECAVGLDVRGQTKATAENNP